jgi:hypothetical protein
MLTSCDVNVLQTYTAASGLRADETGVYPRCNSPSQSRSTWPSASSLLLDEKGGQNSPAPRRAPATGLSFYPMGVGGGGGNDASRNGSTEAASAAQSWKSATATAKDLHDIKSMHMYHLSSGDSLTSGAEIPRDLRGGSLFFKANGVASPSPSLRDAVCTNGSAVTGTCCKQRAASCCITRCCAA